MIFTELNTIEPILRALGENGVITSEPPNLMNKEKKVCF